MLDLPSALNPELVLVTNSAFYCYIVWYIFTCSEVLYILIFIGKGGRNFEEFINYFENIVSDTEGTDEYNRHKTIGFLE